LAFNFNYIQIACIRIFKITTLVEKKNRQNRLEGESVFYENGKVSIKGGFKNGLREGVLIHYYPNDSIKTKVFYVNDKAEGEVTGYLENGRLRYKGFYKNGKKYGDEYFYYPNKCIEAFHTYDILGNKFNIIRYDKKNNLVKVLGYAFSKNLYSIKANKSIAILKDNNNYDDVDNLYVTVSTPSNLNLAFFVKINDKPMNDFVIRDNTLEIPHAFSAKGIYNLSIGGRISDSTKVLEQNVLDIKIIKN